MGPTWVLSAPGGPMLAPKYLATWVGIPAQYWTASSLYGLYMISELLYPALVVQISTTRVPGIIDPAHFDWIGSILVHFRHICVDGRELLQWMTLR